MTTLAVLAEVLQRAEVRAHEPRYVPADEVARWPAGAFDSMKAIGLLVGSSDADLTTCDECLEPHLEQVQYLVDGAGISRPAIYCPSNGIVFIDPRRLQRWRVDLRQFATSLARSRDANARVREVIVGRCWTLGAVRTDRVSSALYLVRGATWTDAPELFDTQFQFPPGAIALHFGSLTLTRLPNGCVWVPLTQVLSDEEGHLILRPELLSVYSHEVSPKYAFQRSEKLWHLSFGNDSEVVPHRSGLIYIAYLLREPGRLFGSLALSSMKAGYIGERMAIDDASSLSVSDAGADQELMDREYRAEVQNRLTGLDAKKNQAGLSASEAEEMETLRHHLKGSLGLHRRPRKFASEDEKARIRVSQAIRRAIDIIRPSLPAMASHLDDSITTGSAFCYSPDRAVPWIVDPNASS